MSNLPQRCWINQPSTQQPLHHLHGTNVLAVKETESTYRIYFLSGPIISQQAPANSLSKNWVGNTAPAKAGAKS